MRSPRVVASSSPSPDVARRPDRRPCCRGRCASVVAATRLDRRELARRAQALAALADPVRLAVVMLLARHQALCVCEIQLAFDLGQPTISHHLRVLREAGLVRVKRRGLWAYYSLRREALGALARSLLAV